MLSLESLLTQPPPNAIEYFALLTNTVFELDTDQARFVLSRLLKLADKCLNDLSPVPLLRAAAFKALLTTCLKADSSKELGENFASSQSDPSRAVRLAALQVLSVDAITAECLAAVTSKVLAKLSVLQGDAAEDDFECIGHLLDLLHRRLSYGTTDVENASLLAHLAAVMDDPRFTAVKTECMKCYAIALERSSTLDGKAFAKWLDLLEQSLTEDENKRMFALTELSMTYN